MNRYEFCYLDSFRRPCFAIVYDTEILSACERLLCRSVNFADLQTTAQSNFFIRGWEPNETISVKETTSEASGTFHCGEATIPVPVSVPITISLEGIDLSQLTKK